MSQVIAIDPSLSNTAIFMGYEDGIHAQCFKSTNCGDHVHGRVHRIERLVGEIDDWIRDRLDPEAMVLIEAYSFGSNDARAKFSAEYGGVLRSCLVQFSQDIYEVAPATLKKFATGVGKGKKEQVIAHVTKRYGHIFDTNDEYDAFVLFQMGLVATGQREPNNAAERTSVEKVLA